LSLKTVKSLSQKLTILMDREKLISVILETITESFRLDKAGILLRKGTSSLEKSVNDYVSWLREEKIAKDITEFAQKKMKQLGVVRYVDTKL